MKRVPKMIEINLLPDVKQEVIRARKNRNLVATWSTIVASVAATVVLLLIIVVFVAQPLLTYSQNLRIDSDFNRYKNYPGAVSLLTIQKQLNNLDDLHAKKAITSRVFVMITQVITNGKLKVNTSKIEVTPHDKRIIITAHSEAGHAELERLIKTLNETKIAYATNQDLEKLRVNDQAKESGQAKAKDDLEYVDLLKDKASLLSDPSFQDSASEQRTLGFKIGLLLDDKFFLDSTKNILVQGVSYKDATDSYQSIPQSLLGGGKEAQKQDRADQKGQNNG